MTIYTVSLISIENKMPLRWDTRFENRDQKKVGKRRDWTRVDRVEKMEWHAVYHLHHWRWCVNWRCRSSSGSSCTSWLTDVLSSQRWVIYSQTNDAVSKLYLRLPVCLICRCVFWLGVLVSDLSRCFLTYNVFWICVVFFWIMWF